jgi:drug/metabolite transporter (DMT)-like permease
MNQSPIFRPSTQLWGAVAMVGAGLVFAIINVLTQWASMELKYPPTALAFWQYGLALLAFVPWLVRHGPAALRTRHFLRHVVRVVLATLGVQFFVSSLAHVPIWQVIAIDMTSPFIVVLGAGMLLREPTGLRRIAATIAGFVGAMIILAPWSDEFSGYSLLPLGAAAMWAGSSLMTKTLTEEETPEAVTAYMLALLTPINAGFLLAGSGLSVSLAFTPPTGSVLWIVLALAALTAASQFLLTLAYAKADAAYLQPFDYVRLPVNIVAGLVVFHYAPAGYLWPGATLIVAASLYLLHTDQEPLTAAAVPAE